MEDYEIIVKILNRDQAGLDQAEQQYGDACRAVAIRILGDDRSAEMVVREAFLRAWETIPKQQPKNLKTYLLRITRNLAVEHSPRDGEYDRVLQELDRCVSGQTEGFDAPCNTKALLRAIDEFLSGLAPAKRQMFVLRYWYVCSVEEISNRCGNSSSQVRGTLKQARTQLQECLLKQELPGLSAVQFLQIFGSIRDKWILEPGEVKRPVSLWVKGAALGVGIC